MFKSIHQISNRGTKKKGTQKRDSDEEPALFNRVAFLEEKVGRESGKRDESGIEPEPGPNFLSYCKYLYKKRRKLVPAP